MIEGLSESGGNVNVKDKHHLEPYRGLDISDMDVFLFLVLREPRELSLVCDTGDSFRSFD